MPLFDPGTPTSLTPCLPTPSILRPPVPTTYIFGPRTDSDSVPWTPERYQSPRSGDRRSWVDSLRRVNTTLSEWSSGVYCGPVSCPSPSPKVPDVVRWRSSRRCQDTKGSPFSGTNPEDGGKVLLSLLMGRERRTSVTVATCLGGPVAMTSTPLTPARCTDTRPVTVSRSTCASPKLRCDSRVSEVPSGR